MQVLEHDENMKKNKKSSDKMAQFEYFFSRKETSTTHGEICAGSIPYAFHWRCIFSCCRGRFPPAVFLHPWLSLYDACTEFSFHVCIHCVSKTGNLFVFAITLIRF